MNPIRTFIHRPVFTGMLTFAVLVFGVVAYPRIGVDQYPEIDFPFVTVTTVLPGADPEAIERTVTKPLEETLNTLAGLDTLRSVNLENVSQIIIRFDLERNADIAAQDVRDKVQATLSKLPREIRDSDCPEARHRRRPGGDARFLGERPRRAADEARRRRGEARPAADPGGRRGRADGRAQARDLPSSRIPASSRVTGSRRRTSSRRSGRSRWTSRAGARSSRGRSGR